MSLFLPGHRSWEAESRLSLLRGGVFYKGAPAEAQAVEPLRQGRYGAPGGAGAAPKDPRQVQRKEKVTGI